MLDDLFTISTYSPTCPSFIGAEPDDTGWICGSHFVVLHRETIYDSVLDGPVPLSEYSDCTRYVKRLFRVVPKDHPRGL